MAVHGIYKQMLFIAVLSVATAQENINIVRQTSGYGDFAHTGSNKAIPAQTDCRAHSIPAIVADVSVGDGFCDDGSYGSYDLCCDKFDFDGGDCSVSDDSEMAALLVELQQEDENDWNKQFAPKQTGQDDDSNDGIPRGIASAPTDSCIHSCGERSKGGECWCNDSCDEFGDCCSDYIDFCTSPKRRLDDYSCDGLCNGMNIAGNCYCTGSCVAYGDCCSDIDTYCPDLTTESPADETTEAICQGCSGCCDTDLKAENDDGSSCSCNMLCYLYGDCCDDFEDQCGAITEEPIEKCFDCDGTSCIGHEQFVGDGICDDETTTLNFNCDEWSYDGGDCDDAGNLFTGSCEGQCGLLVSYFDARRRQLFTAPDSDSCDGLCGLYTTSCFCSLDCTDYEDCCDDYVEMCETRNPAPQGNWHDKPDERHCWCDRGCIEAADCCDDYYEMCDAYEGMASSCEDSCGQKRASGCWCDKICEDHADCCDDFEEFCGCGMYSYEPCTGCTDKYDACNYDPSATVDDGSCTYEVEGFNCDGECLERVDCEGVCGGPKYWDECGECVLPENRGQSTDCLGECFGSATYDACGTCGGAKDDVADCECPNPDQVRDCSGACDGVKELNVCGICTSNAYKWEHIDCFGVCFGSGVEDSCGVCNGDGTSCQDDYCEGERVTDCAGVCDGTLVKDNCGICGGKGSTRDCAGVCTGPTLEDQCGVCGGNGTSCLGCTDLAACNYWIHAKIDDGSCSFAESEHLDCNGNCASGYDCYGACGGSAEVDECGVCNGFGATCTTPFCQGGKVDCWGECNGGVTEDACGVCGGDSSVCVGCMDSTACNYNPTAEISPPMFYNIRNGLDENGCTFPEDDLHDCDGVCLTEVDCRGICGGPYMLDDCQVCGLNSGSGATCCVHPDDIFEEIDSRRRMQNIVFGPTPSPGHHPGDTNPAPHHGNKTVHHPAPAPDHSGLNPAPKWVHKGPAPINNNPGPNHDLVPSPDDHNSCLGYCGDVTPGGCWCDKLCTNYGDCCFDIVQACGGTDVGDFPIPSPSYEPAVGPGPTHIPSPGSHNSDAPAPLHDNPSPAWKFNPAPSFHGPAPSANHTGPGPQVPAPDEVIWSCEGQCINPNAIADGCYCDILCSVYDDCCPDFYKFCAPSCIGEFCPDGTPDCAGECDGGRQFDECMVCDGDGSTCVGSGNPWWCPDGYDCFGECGGFAEVDSCGVCGGFGSSCSYPTDTDSDGLLNGHPYCYGESRDCAGECKGTKELDACLVCDGDSSTCVGCLKETACNYDEHAIIGSEQCYYPPSEDTNCFGFCDQDFDCLGICGGTAHTDSCGVCLGHGASCRSPSTQDYCKNGYVNCFGQCNQHDTGAVFDACGVCDGDSSTCTGCADTSACNYNPLATISDDSACSYFDNKPGTHYDNCLGKCDDGYDCEGTCGGSTVYDICGVCGGNAWDVGCDGECFSGLQADECGVCGGFGDSCEEGYCSGGFVADCFGECGGTAELDLCGVCNGFNKLRDCDGVCFGSSFMDACGICGGDSSECTGCGDHNACNYDMIAVVSDDATCLYPPDHIHDCWGNCAVDIDCTGLCDGNNEEDACGVCGGDSSTCVGCMDTNSCNFDEHASIPDITLCFYETVLLSCMGVCKHDVDCGGNCDGYLTVDACGVCNGDSTLCVGCTNPAACNYEATATIDDGSCTYSATCNTVCTTDVDCAGTCDGSLVVDECEVCGGFGASCTDGAYCAAGTVDCKGECDGGREFDACGICDGDTSTCIGCNDEDACNYLESASIGIPSMCTYPDWDGVDCSGNCVVGFDCKGHCGGDRVIDVCGVCGGFGASCTENYCDGGIIDCAGECGGGRKIDNCGVCDGNNEACTVEDFCAYGTVDCFGICHCPFTTSDPELCARPILDLPAPSVCSLFNDGSFEGLTTTKTYEDVSSLGSWTPSGPLYLAASEAAFWGGLAATDAGYFLVMQGDSYINQTLHATHWKYYSLTFDAAARPDYGMDTLYVNVDGTRIYSLVVPDVEEFQPHRVLFQAESSLVTLQIFHEADAVTGDPDAAVFIDNVEVSLSSQVLLDGSFEGLSTTTTYESTSYLGSWTGEGVLIATGSSAWGGLDAPSGYHYFAEQGDGWLSQYVPTVVGATYALTFYAAARPGYGMETLYVYVDSEVAHTLELVDEDETGVIGFERFSLNFYATNALTKLEFHHRVQSGDLTLFLDAVAVAPTSDLMLDGSFEGVSTVTEYEDTTNPGSWKGDTTIVRTGDDTHGGILTPAGNYYAVLGATQKITQTVPTTTGSSYAISFIVSCAPSYGMDKMYVIINGLTVYRLVVEDSLSWAEHTLNFVAEDESSIISFYHGPSAIQSANTAVYIDKIQIALTDDIVVDGGFEGISTTTEYEYTEDYLDMWTGSGVIIFSGNEEWGGLEAPEGLYYVGRQGAGIIEQNLTTVPDQHYELSFKTAARPDYGADVLHVVLHGAIVYQLKLEDTGEFMEHKLNYQAQSELTLVTFQHVIEADGNLTVLLDEVTAEPTQDIVLDGSFEGLALTTAYHDVSSVDSTTGHWAGDGTIVRSGNSHFGDLEAPAGDYYFVLPSGSSISQTLQTTVGKHYTVSFYAAPRPDYGAEPLTVHIRNEIVYTLELADDKEFEQHYINFYANTSTTLLEFQQTEDDDTHAILLDEIKITESENLVIDGSFEGISTTLAYEYMPEGAVGAWQDSGDTSFHVIVKSENSIWGGLAAPSGDYYIALQQDTIIAQTFHTTKGDFYVLSFAVASRPSVGMDTLLLYVDGELSHTIVGADGEFVEMNFLFAASSDTMNIRFVHVDSADADKSVFLDDVTFMLYDESSVMDDHLVSC